MARRNPRTRRPGHRLRYSGARAGHARAYRSAWRQYDAWCTRLGLPALSGDPCLVGMYLIAAAERLAGLSLDPGHPSIALLLDGIRWRKGTRPARQATPISPAMLTRK
jgi:hypothetical protein